LQANEIKSGTSGAPTSVIDLTYTYGTTNNNGNLQSIGYSGGGLSYTQSFGYDALNRLTTSNENSGASWSQTSGYDQYGNRWIDYGGGNHNISFSTSTNCITTSGFTYDSSGNLTNDGVHAYTFDAENKINKVDNASAYVYDGEGQRVRKLVGENTRFIYGIGGQMVAEFDGSNGNLKKEYVQCGATLITVEPTAVNSNGTRYSTSDHLGSPRVVTNSSAGVVSRHDYLPFGEELGTGIGGRTNGMGFSVADNVRQKFTQKERDNETGLDFFRSRYYASTQGRFTSADSFAGSTINPQSLNRYAYVFGNPLRFRDPSGHLAIGGVGNDLNDWLKWYKWHDRHFEGVNQDPSKPNLPPAVAPAGVPDIPEGTVGTATVTEWHPIPPHKSFWERVKTFFGFGSSAAAAGVSTWGKPETLQDHFDRHGNEFGARTPDEYAQQAQEFFIRAQEEGLPTKIDPQGVIRVYDSETNTFCGL